MENKRNLTPMEFESVIKKLENVQGGRFAYVTFYSLPKTTNGETIYKVSKVHTQCKIDYTHRQDYVEPTFKREEDSTYIISKAIKHNNKTNNDLLVIYPVANSKVQTSYYNANGDEMTKEQAQAIIKPKAPSKTPIIFMTPNARQILEIVGG